MAVQLLSDLGIFVNPCSEQGVLLSGVDQTKASQIKTDLFWAVYNFDTYDLPCH